MQVIWQDNEPIGADAAKALQSFGIGLPQAGYDIGQQGLPAACRALREERADTGGMDAAVSGHCAGVLQAAVTAVYGADGWPVAAWVAPTLRDPH